MKYINKYLKFKSINEEEEISKGEMLAFQLRDYSTKKNNLKSLVLNNIETDKDISKAYEDIVQENPFLQKHGQILKIETGIKKAENRLEENKESINKLEEDIKLVDKLSDDDDKANQQSDIENRIDAKKEDVVSIEDQIKELEEQHKEVSDELSNMIKEKEAELREIEKSPFNQ